jgi:excisionase family DNA binding protein
MSMSDSQTTSPPIQSQEKKHPESPFFNVRELAAYLRLKPCTIYKNAEQGRIPGIKRFGRWLFRKTVIDRWLESKHGTRER